jgi:hypothetical protein
MHVHLLGVQGLNFRNQIEPQEGSVRQGTLAAGKLSKDIAPRTAFSRAGPAWLCTLLVIGVLLTVPDLKQITNCRRSRLQRASDKISF